MRKLSLVILSVALVMNLHAQKAKVVTAYNYYNYKEFDKAKAAIDEASVNGQMEKNKVLPRYDLFGHCRRCQI